MRTAGRAPLQVGSLALELGPALRALLWQLPGHLWQRHGGTNRLQGLPCRQALLLVLCVCFCLFFLLLSSALDQILDELVVLVCLWPLAFADLRAQPLGQQSNGSLAVSVDTAGDGGLGACTARVSDADWSQLYRIAELRGEHADPALPS